jgi:hypothetical protein
LPTAFAKKPYNSINYALKLCGKESCEFFILNSYYLPGYEKRNLLSLEPTDKELSKKQKEKKSCLIKF